jgi:chromosome segregation ATPase
MIEAFIEILVERPKQKRLDYVNYLQKCQKELAKAKGLLPGKEALLPTVKADYDKIKESAHPFSSDSEATEHAMQTALEMSKMLDTLDVELAGIREKLKAIQDYWKQDGEWTKEALAKLQELQIIQTIELKGAEGRRNAAVEIRQREKDFLDLFDQWTSLESEIEHLRDTIEYQPKRIAEYEVALATNPKLLPPKIYENKVVIYRVGTD